LSIHLSDPSPPLIFFKHLSRGLPIADSVFRPFPSRCPCARPHIDFSMYSLISSLKTTPPSFRRYLYCNTLALSISSPPRSALPLVFACHYLPSPCEICISQAREIRPRLSISIRMKGAFPQRTPKRGHLNEAFS